MDALGFTMDELREEMDKGWVRAQKHPTEDLWIYNYTENAQYAKHWNPITLACRGLILDEYGTIVARPWRKFFNYGEGRLKINDDMPVEVTDKMDGSLGILYATDYCSGIATRGSFNSDQSVHASKIFFEQYADVINWSATDEYTFLFEIIYPANRIVLNYGEMDDLVLLGAVHKERGYYLGPREAAGVLEWDGPVTQVFEYKNLAEAFAAPMRPNAEGFVCRSGTEMVKIKQIDYVELHKIVTNLTERTVWAALADGKTVEDLCSFVPDEWHAWLEETAQYLEQQFSAVQESVLDEFMEIMHTSGYLTTESRKDFAQAASKSPYKAYLFLLLDRKPIDGPIWYSLKPAISKE